MRKFLLIPLLLFYGSGFCQSPGSTKKEVLDNLIKNKDCSNLQTDILTENTSILYWRTPTTKEYCYFKNDISAVYYIEPNNSTVLNAYIEVFNKKFDKKSEFEWIVNTSTVREAYNIKMIYDKKTKKFYFTYTSRLF